MSAVLSAPALGQETLPTIHIRKPKPVRHAARAAQARARQTLAELSRAPARRPLSPREAAAGSGRRGDNGTEIGPGNNGQLCAGGVCNDPKSYAAPIQSVGTKVNTPVMDTPVTTKTVTHQMLEDQQVTTLDQALRNVSGVTIAGGGNAAVGNSFTKIMIRGFPTQNYFRDGFRVDSFGLNFAGAGTVEMANVESVEVLKGPAAILYGAVEPGGIVNINTKQPLDKPAYSIQQQIGSYAAYRTSLDATGPLTQNKDLLYRFTMSYENDGSFRTLRLQQKFDVQPRREMEHRRRHLGQGLRPVSAEQSSTRTSITSPISTTSSRSGSDAASISGRSRLTASSRISPRSPGITTSTRTGRSSRPSSCRPCGMTGRTSAARATSPTASPIGGICFSFPGLPTA